MTTPDNTQPDAVEVKALTANQTLVVMGQDHDIVSRRARTRARNDLRAMGLMYSEGHGLTPEGEAIRAALTPPDQPAALSSSLQDKGSGEAGFYIQHLRDKAKAFRKAAFEQGKKAGPLANAFELAADELAALSSQAGEQARSVPDGCILVASKADEDCGCPEEEWETPWGYLFMHLNAGKPSDVWLDLGDDGEIATHLTASTVEAARKASFSWASIAAMLAAAPASSVVYHASNANDVVYSGSSPDVTQTAPAPEQPSPDRGEVERRGGERAIARVVNAARAIAWQAGIGGRETAGAIVSYLAISPEEIAPFVAGELSPLDFAGDWMRGGCLTWYAVNGKIVSPEDIAASPTEETAHG